MYGVCFTCLGRLHSYSSFEQGGVESKVFRLINSSPLTDCLQPLSHGRNVASLALFHRYFHDNCFSDLANCMPLLLPRPRCTSLASSSHLYMTSILSLSSLSLVNSGILSLLLYFHLPMTWTVSRERYQDTYPNLLAHKFELSRDRHYSGLFCSIFAALGCLPST